MGPRAPLADSLEELAQFSSRQRRGMLSGERWEAAAPQNRREEEGGHSGKSFWGFLCV